MGHSAQQMKHENAQKISPNSSPNSSPRLPPKSQKFVAAISLWGKSSVRNTLRRSSDAAPSIFDRLLEVPPLAHVGKLAAAKHKSTLGPASALDTCGECRPRVPPVQEGTCALSCTRSCVRSWPVSNTQWCQQTRNLEDKQQYGAKFYTPPPPHP